jgi:hypothetical protein
MAVLGGLEDDRVEKLVANGRIDVWGQQITELI